MKIRRYYIDLFGISIMVGATLAAIIKMQTLPDVIPFHWNIKGIVDNQADKHWIFMGSIISLAVYVVLTLVFNYAFKLTAAKNTATDSEAMIIIEQRGCDYLGLIKVSLMMIPLIYTMAITFIYPSSNPFLYLIIGSIICFALSLFFMVKFVQNRILQKGENVSLQETLMHYIGYYDPNDPNVFVEKRIGVGTTVNLATRGGKTFFYALVVFPFLFLIGMAIFLVLK